MTRFIIILSLYIFPLITGQAQDRVFGRFEFLIGNWEGTGEGFSSGKSSIHSTFEFLLNKKYIKVTNSSIFEPDDKNPEGSKHEDWGMISYDTDRGLYVFRQFHGEGFVNQYVLNGSLSNDTTFIFETEAIENFMKGGSARFTIHKLGADHIETVFDVSMPGHTYTCFGRNHLFRK